MFSWDFISFYSIEFLFYTITKHITASQVLILTSVYILAKIIFQLPSVAISDYIGKRKAIILGNILLVIYILMLIFAPDIKWILIANMFCGFGFDLKNISETNLLYDSVATKGGDGIYTKIDSKGASAYYILETIFALVAGYLFIINNYIPVYIALSFTILSTILSFKFNDIHRGKKDKEKIKLKKFLQEYTKDIKNCLGFIKKSKRIRAYLIFATIFYGLIKIIATYRGDLLINIGVSESQFSIIFAILSLLAAISASYSKKVQKYFKNKTLTFLSLSYVISVILIGIISLKVSENIALPLILIFYTIMKMCDSQWYITEYTYLHNFTNSYSRNKISFAFELITGLGASIITFSAAVILDYLNIKYAILLIGLIFLAILIIVLDYMRTRFGLKPNEYTKDDIKFTINK